MSLCSVFVHYKKQWRMTPKHYISLFLSSGKKGGSLLVIYTAYSKIWSLPLSHSWEAVGSHRAAPGDQPQILSQYLGQGYRLEIDLTSYFDCGGNWSTRRKPSQTQGENADSTQRGPASEGIKSRTVLGGNSANHWAIVLPTEPLCHDLTTITGVAKYVKIPVMTFKLSWLLLFAYGRWCWITVSARTTSDSTIHLNKYHNYTNVSIFK